MSSADHAFNEENRASLYVDIVDERLKHSVSKLEKKERVYYPCPTGFVFAATGLIQSMHLPFYGMIVFSVDDKPVRVRVDGVEFEERALALWAKDIRFEAANTRFVAVAANPLHPSFRSFVRLPSPHSIFIDRDRFASLRELAVRAVDGCDFSDIDAMRLFESAHTIAHDALPSVAPLDARAQRLMSLLCMNPRSSLTELSMRLELSYHRTSHLFAEAVGVSIRTYQLWQKLHRAGLPMLQGASLTEVAHAAGFVDSAHFSKAFQTAFGRCPKEMFKMREVVVSYPDAFTEKSIARSIAAVTTVMPHYRLKPGRKTTEIGTPAE